MPLCLQKTSRHLLKTGIRAFLWTDQARMPQCASYLGKKIINASVATQDRNWCLCACSGEEVTTLVLKTRSILVSLQVQCVKMSVVTMCDPHDLLLSYPRLLVEPKLTRVAHVDMLAGQLLLHYDWFTSLRLFPGKLSLSCNNVWTQRPSRKLNRYACR